MFSKLFLIALALFLVITCLLTVSNVNFEWSKPIMGYSAGVAGVLALFSAFQGVNLSATK